MAPHGKCCGDNHQHNESPEIGREYSLYTKINKENLECLNEALEGSGKKVFKPWEEKLNGDYVESDVDEELLFNIPFTGNVKLKGIIVVGEDGDTHPNKMRLFKNRPGMTFDDAGVAADQEFELHRDTNGTLEYNTKVATFSSVHHLSIHFPTNFGGTVTRIDYIGLKGEFTEAKPTGVVNCVYEVRPQIHDHKNPLDDDVARQVQ